MDQFISLIFFLTLSAAKYLYQLMQFDFSKAFDNQNINLLFLAFSSIFNKIYISYSKL